MAKDEKLMLRELYSSANANQRFILERFFPELKESEDERIRKALISVLTSDFEKDTTIDGITVEEILAWLEKQGKQKEIVNNQSDYVDLGLPSGTLWAKCNLGAEKETEFGYFYQWGDTKGYKGLDKHQFNWNGYTYGSWKNFTKYNNTDGKLVLDNEDDPVFVATGGKMKSPTKEQLQELIDHTNHEWIETNELKGMKFINKNDDTKYIFIPAAGYHSNGSHNGVGSWGGIWSAYSDEHSTYGAWHIFFDAGYVGMGFSYRCDGFSVRGVINEPLK